MNQTLQISESLPKFKKLFFLKQKPHSSNLSSLVAKTSLLKIKIAASKVINYPSNWQPQVNFLDSFYCGNYTENSTTFLLSNSLFQNFFLATPENFWNTLLGMRQDKISRFYLINKYPVLKVPSKWYATRKKKFRRTPYKSFHINDLILRTWINKQYSLGNFYNKEIRFSFYYGEEFIEYTKDITWYGRGFGTYLSSIEDGFSIRCYQLCFLLKKSKIYWTSFVLNLLSSKKYKQTSSTYLLNFFLIFNSDFLDYENVSNLILLPKDFEMETPFTYKGRKFGRQQHSSFLKSISHTGGYSFKFPRNMKSKSGLNSLTKDEFSFRRNFFQANPNSSLADYYYHDWWKSISLRKSDVGFNRNYALSFSVKSEKILSKKDRLFESIFSKTSFFPLKSPASSFEKSQKVEKLLMDFTEERFYKKFALLKRKN